MYNVSTNNLSPLPFYDSYAFFEPKWDSRKWYANGQIYPLVSPHYVIPFFFKIGRGVTISSLKIFKLCSLGMEIARGNFIEVHAGSTSWLDRFKSNGLSIIGQDLAVYNPSNTKMLDKGYYYMRFDTNTGVSYTSEIFRIEETDTDKIIKMEWSNDTDVVCEGNKIPYTRDFRNQVFVEASLGKPTYEYEEEGESRNGFFYPIRQLSYKRYRFKFIAPEYLCDVIRLMPMADDITIVSEGIPLTPSAFNVDFNWIEGGHYAEVDCEFTTDTVVKKIGGQQIVPANETFQREKITREV